MSATLAVNGWIAGADSEWAWSPFGLCDHFARCRLWSGRLAQLRAGLRARAAVSPNGDWIATAYIDGILLSAENERVHVWRWWQPRFRWLGCQVLEAKNESPTKLQWDRADELRVQHGFRASELIGFRDRCGPIHVSIERKFAPYS